MEKWKISLFVVLCSVLASLAFHEVVADQGSAQKEGGVQSANDINGDTVYEKEFEHGSKHDLTDLSGEIDEDCEKRYHIRELRQRVHDLQQDISKKSYKDKEIEGLKKEITLLKEKEKAARHQSTVSDNLQKTRQLEASFGKLRAELEGYKQKIYQSAWNRFSEDVGSFVLGVKTLVVHNLAPVLSNLFHKTTSETLLGGVFISIKGYSNILMESVTVVWNLQLLPGVHSVFERVLITMGLNEDATLFSVISEAWSQLLKLKASIEPELSAAYRTLRSKSIDALKANPRLHDLAPDIVDLSLFSVAFLVGLLLVNPIVGFIGKIIQALLGAVVWAIFFMLKLPFYVIRGMLYVLTLGWGSWVSGSGRAVKNPKK